MFSGTGQINMDQTFGKKIYEIAQKDTVRNIIEIGSWNGQGSTVCLMNGIIFKKNSKLYSFEACSEMHNKAKTFWNNYHTNNKLHLLNGTLHRNIVNFQENNPLFVREWYHYEEKVLNQANLIKIDDIENVDFVVLDGGEYTTDGDFEVLVDKNPKYIALDDTRVYKCSKIRQYLLNSNDWKLYDENINERNGWAIFYNPNNI
jgi:hypothetical protein